MDDLALIDNTENNEFTSDRINNGKCKALLLAPFPFMATILETVFKWPEKSITPFANVSSLLESYKKSPSHVIVISDHPGDIGHLAEEVLSRFYGYALVLLSCASKNDLTNQLKNSEMFPEFDNCTKEKLIVHCQIPFNIAHLTLLANHMVNINTKISGGRLISPSESQKYIIDNMTERILDKLDADQRHLMKNCMSADRILNGALRSGEYNLKDSEEWKRALDAYQALIYSNNEWKDDQKSIRFKQAKETLEEFKEKIMFITMPSLWHDAINKVLIIDDQVEMWKPVWDFIFGSDKIDIIGEANEGIDLIKCNNGDYDFVILDLNLGDNKPNGLSIIPYIKSIRFDLPIVVMTAYDNAEIARDAYKRGASFCFVKERRDKEDRKSKDYFDMLKKILSSLPLNSSLERIICKDFQKIEPSLNNNDSNACIELRKAIFYLLLDPSEIHAQNFLFGSSNEEWPRFQLIAKGCYESFEIFVTSLLKYHGVDFDPLANAAEKYYLLRQILGTSIPNMPSHLELYHGVGHELKETEKPNYQRDKVLNFSQEIIAFFDEYYKNIILKDNENMVLDEGKNDLMPYPIQEQKEEGHAERSRIGALRLLEGAYRKKFKEPLNEREKIADTNVDELISLYDMENKTVLQKGTPLYSAIFIDDEGISSGWKRVLDLLLPKYYVRYLEYTKSIKCDYILQEVGKADFVILDLQLPAANGTPSEATGIFILRAIKDKYPYLPVIVLTASDDAVHFRQVMSIGAFDYFPKTEETFFLIKDEQYFITYYVQFCKIVDRLNHYLESMKPIALYLQIFNAFNHYKALDYLDISGKKNYFWVGESKEVSSSVNRKVYSILQRSFFFLLGDQNITLNYFLKRLYLNNAQNSEWIMENQGFLEAVKATEYCLQILKTLYCTNKSYPYDKQTMGALCE